MSVKIIFVSQNLTSFSTDASILGEKKTKTRKI
jgi:hypothetical protein